MLIDPKWTKELVGALLFAISHAANPYKQPEKIFEREIFSQFLAALKQITQLAIADQMDSLFVSWTASVP